MDLLKNNKNFFIAGTDTDVGKTTFTLRLLHFLKQQNLRTVALKPVATGCELTSEGWRNQDAMSLQNAASIKLTYDEVNPIKFVPPISPNIAAQQINFDLSVANIMNAYQRILTIKTDHIIVEGSGGWLTPINDQETMADLALAFNFSVILVVGIKLGCLNHALLTWQSLQNSKIKIAGWVANCFDPQVLNIQENIATLKKCLKAPLIEIIPPLENCAKI